MTPEPLDIESAPVCVALAELEMLRQSETILANLGLPTWGDSTCILLRPSSALKEPTQTDHPSIGFYVLGQEYFIAHVAGGPMDGAYFVVDLSQPEGGASPPLFVSLDEAIIHVIDQAHQGKLAAELEEMASKLNAAASELETATELLNGAIGQVNEAAGQEIQATRTAPSKAMPASRKKKKKS